MKQPLRRWQQRALEQYRETQPRIFTCLATPASGKTRFGLAIAEFLLSAMEVKQLIVFCHTDQIRRQWQLAAQALGINLSTDVYRQRDGYLFSYQQLTEESFVEKVNYLMRGRRRSLAILDEPHHLADAKAWGDGIKAALKRVHRILLLSGTLFRHDEGVIPFVNYRDGVLVPDFEYSYAEALKEGIVGPVYFPVYGGEASWRFSGKADTAQFGANLSDRDLARQLNTAIVSEDWLGSVITAADKRLRKIRQADPTAGGLITAKDHRHAKAVAQIVESITGMPPAIALSDNRRAYEVITGFTNSTAPWLVAVRMISEGVDIPRLRVGIYATNILTELFFRQVIGRLVRTAEFFQNQDAYLYIPQHPVLLQYAMGIVEERYHLLPELSVPDGTGGTREVVSFLEPVSAIARPGEILNPVTASNEDLLGMLQQGLALLAQAQANIDQAQVLFKQVGDGIAQSGLERSPIEVNKHVSLSNDERHLLNLLALHRNASISQGQLEQLSGQPRMDFYNNLTKLKLEGLAAFPRETDAVAITDEGITQTGKHLPAPIRSGGDVVRLWSIVLSQRQITLLEGLVTAHPRWVDRKELVYLAGYSASMTKRIGSDLGRLVICSLVEEGGEGLFKLNPKVMAIPFSGY